VDGVTQPGPAPRFSRTPAEITKPPSPPGSDTDQALADWGIEESRIAKLKEAGALS
jgi:alpha-methylacyl-CoA racemase